MEGACSVSAKKFLPALLLVLAGFAPRESAAQPWFETCPHYFDANKLALAPRKTALALLRASKKWDAIVPSKEGFDVSTRERNVAGVVVIEKGRVVALNLMLDEPPPTWQDEAVLSILEIPPPRGASQRYPRGMRWRDPKGKFKYIDVMFVSKSRTMIMVDFLTAYPERL